MTSPAQTRFTRPEYWVTIQSAKSTDGSDLVKADYHECPEGMLPPMSREKASEVLGLSLGYIPSAMELPRGVKYATLKSPSDASQRATEIAADSSDSKPGASTPSQPRPSFNKSNAARAGSVFVRNTSGHRGFTRLEGFKVPGHLDMAEFKSNRAASLFSYCSKFLQDAKARSVNLRYDDDQVTNVVISRKVKGCDSDVGSLGKILDRPAERKIWKPRTEQTQDDDEDEEENSEQDEEDNTEEDEEH